MSSRCTELLAGAAAALLGFLPGPSVQAQAGAARAPHDSAGTVIGRVSDVETGEALSNVNFYLSFTTAGGSTDAEGRCVLDRIPPGPYDAIASRVGYGPFGERIVVTAGDTVFLDIRLTPKLIETGAVDVTAGPDSAWSRSLDRFRRVFIGTSDFAAECTILNPETIDFTTRGDTLIAGDDHLLTIENRALGYRVHVVLAEFTWNLARDAGRFLIYPYFEQLPDTGTDEGERWGENREKAFRGSIRHFFRSLINAETKDESFAMYSGSQTKLTSGQGHQVVDDDFEIARDTVHGLLEVSFPGDVMVEYGERDTDPFGTTDPGRPRRQLTARGVPPLRISIVRMTGASIVLDPSGNLVDPLSIEVAGDWALRRIEFLLPND